MHPSIVYVQHQGRDATIEAASIPEMNIPCTQVGTRPGTGAARWILQAGCHGHQVSSDGGSVTKNHGFIAPVNV